MAVPPPSPHPILDKASLRKQLRLARAAYVAQLRADRLLDLAQVEAAARAFEHIPAGTTVALYRAFGDELDPTPLAHLLAGRGHKLALPHVTDAQSPMRFLAWHAEAPLYEGPFGLHQPHAESEIVAPGVIVVPLVGFDRAGARIGQGAGYYDRALTAFPGALLIGYGWSVQELPHISHDPWDVPLHAVATEREWIAMPGAPA